MCATSTKSVLVYDDDPATVDLVKSTFEGLGCSVTHDPFSLGRVPFDLVIADARLAMTSEGLANSWWQSKLAILGNEEGGDPIDLGRIMGAEYYLAKPLGRADLARLASIL